MPASKASRRERFAQVIVRDNPDATAAAQIDPQTTAPEVAISAEVTAENIINEFEAARLLALRKGQAAAAVTATMAKARLGGLLKERPDSNQEPAAKFDGNYNEAARRIALLLRLAADETASGQEP
jgi:hypothetical protein